MILPMRRLNIKGDKFWSKGVRTKEQERLAKHRTEQKILTLNIAKNNRRAHIRLHIFHTPPIDMRGTTLVKYPPRSNSTFAHHANARISVMPW